ncbi:hypothetical protein GOODEAATRI_027403, partial [Goodea atripinnis]
VMLWFKAVHDLLTSDLQKGSAPLLSLTEEFFNYFLVSSMLGSEVRSRLCHTSFSSVSRQTISRQCSLSH